MIDRRPIYVLTSIDAHLSVHSSFLGVLRKIEKEIEAPMDIALIKSNSVRIWSYNQFTITETELQP